MSELSYKKLSLPFSGKQEDWEEWRFVFDAVAEKEGWMEILDGTQKVKKVTPSMKDSDKEKQKKINEKNK